jgi:hypothetical protein
MQLPLTLPGLTSMSPTDRRKGVAQLTVHIPDAAARTPSTTSRSRWSTLEFRLYALAFAIVVPLMVWIPVKLSSGQSMSWSSYRIVVYALLQNHIRITQTMRIVLVMVGYRDVKS